jgi:hypothetical protein
MMSFFGIQPDTAGLLEIDWIIQNVPGADASMGPGELRALAAAQGIAVPPGGVAEEEPDPNPVMTQLYTPTPGVWTPPPDQLTPPPTQWTPAMIADPSPEIIVPPSPVAPMVPEPSVELDPSPILTDAYQVPPVVPPTVAMTGGPLARPIFAEPLSPLQEPGFEYVTGLPEALPVPTPPGPAYELPPSDFEWETGLPIAPPVEEMDPDPIQHGLYTPIQWIEEQAAENLVAAAQQELAGVGGLPAEPELPAVEQPGMVDGLSFAEWAEQESARLQEQWEETFADFEAQLRMDLAARDAPEQPPGGFKAEEGIDARYFDTQTTMANIFAKQLGIPATGRSGYEDFLAKQWKVPATEYALLGQGLQGGLPTIGEYYAAGLGAAPTFLEGESTADDPISFWNYLEGRSGSLSRMQGDFLSEITNLGPVLDLMSPSLSLSPLQNQQSLFASLGSFGDIAEEQVFRGALNLQYPGFMAENMATQVFDSPLKQEYFTQAPPTIAGPGGIGLRGSLSVFDQPAPDTSFLGFLKEQYGIPSTPNWQIQGALTPLPAPTAVPAPTIDDEGSFLDSVVGTLGAATPSIFR